MHLCQFPCPFYQKRIIDHVVIHIFDELHYGMYLNYNLTLEVHISAISEQILKIKKQCNRLELNFVINNVLQFQDSNLCGASVISMA